MYVEYISKLYFYSAYLFFKGIDKAYLLISNIKQNYFPQFDKERQFPIREKKKYKLVQKRPFKTYRLVRSNALVRSNTLVKQNEEINTQT